MYIQREVLTLQNQHNFKEKNVRELAVLDTFFRHYIH